MVNRSHIAASFSILSLAALLFLAESYFQNSDSDNAYGNVNNGVGTTLLQALDERSEETTAQAAALYHLAGGKKMLDHKVPGFGSKSLAEKNEDALNILSKFFKHKDAKHGPDESAEKQKSSRGRAEATTGDEKNPDATDQQIKANEKSPPEPAPLDSAESPNEVLQNLIAGWSGAGWWQPCSEVCRPKIGTKHTKANFQIFQSCEHKCRRAKTKKLKDVMSHITHTVRRAAKISEKEVAPHTIQKLSKHLIKWAESNGLPSAQGNDANSNLADNQQVGESITGMLIAGWSGAGWWKPCGEVCRPGPDTPHTKANFDKFMACENTCRKQKAEYLQEFLSPKNVVKALAHAKLFSNSTVAHRSSDSSTTPSATHTESNKAAHPAEASSSSDDKSHSTHSADDETKTTSHAASSHKAAAAGDDAESKTASKPHLTKEQRLIQWAEGHGLPKSLADNPADKTKVKHIIARMKADLAVERIKAQMAQDTDKVTDAIRGADPAADTKSFLSS